MVGMDCGQQYAGAGDHPAIEGQLADHDIIRQLFGIGHAHRGKQRERDRQVEVRTFLGHVGGGEIDRDPLGRERQPHRGKRSLDPLAAFAHGLVRQTDDRKARQPRGDLALHLHLARFQPEIGNCPDKCDHAY